MEWSKEVPTKPGKYIIRYVDEKTGRMWYGTYTVYKSGIRRVHLTRPVEIAVFDSWKLEFSKRVENAEYCDVDSDVIKHSGLNGKLVYL